MQINYGKQDISDEDIQVVVETLKSDFLTTGPMVSTFEEEFAKYVGAKHAVAVCNGTAALHLVNLVLKKTDKNLNILTTPVTFAATSNATIYTGGDVEFVDIDPSNFCIDIKKLEHKLNSSTVGAYDGISVVHMGGYPLNIEEVGRVAKKHNLFVIEDACHALGAYHKRDNKIDMVGSCSHSDVTCFSFHPVKHLTTGEGGMITTNDSDLYEKLKLMRSHGMTKDHSVIGDRPGWYYDIPELGYNYRIPDINCALGISQLKRIEENVQRRNVIAKRYLQELDGLPVSFQACSADNRNAYHLFIILAERRDELYTFLRETGIFSQVHYTPVNDLSFYKKKYGELNLPIAKGYIEKTLSIPMFQSMTDDEQSYVISKIREFYGK